MDGLKVKIARRYITCRDAFCDVYAFNDVCTMLDFNSSYCGREVRGHMIKRLVQQRAEKTTRLITWKPPPHLHPPRPLCPSVAQLQNRSLSPLELRTRTGIFMVRDDLFCFFLPSLVLLIFLFSLLFLHRIHSSSFQDGFHSLNGCHSLIVTYYSLKKAAPSHDSRCLTQTYRLDFLTGTQTQVVWRIQPRIHEIRRMQTKSPQYGRFYSPLCRLPAAARISKTG